MKRRLLISNHAVLFLCTSMYLGTGWSLVLFSFPIAPQLTPENYYNQFVPQVDAATSFFTYMTMVMIVCASIMTISEWKQGYRWIPIVVLLGVLAATGLTMKFIFPYNQMMREGIIDAVQLQEVLGKWIFLNKIRVGLWTVQWLAMMSYFGLKAYRADSNG